MNKLNAKVSDQSAYVANTLYAQQLNTNVYQSLDSTGQFILPWIRGN